MAGAIAGIVLLPLVPMIIQLVTNRMKVSELSVGFLLELGASYLFLMMAGAPIAAIVGALSGLVAYLRLTRVSSGSRLVLEAAGLGSVAGGILAFLFAELGDGSLKVAPFLILPLSGVAFGLIVLSLIRRPGQSDA